jgi:hypothetical protein
LIRNKNLHFVCEHVRVRVENYQTPWTCAAWTGTSLRIPVAHGEGSYVAEPETLKELNRNRQFSSATATSGERSPSLQIRMAQPRTSPVSATTGGMSWDSCPIPSAPATHVSARPTAW